MKLPKMIFTEMDRGLYCSNSTCRDEFAHEHANDALFSIDNCKSCFGTTGYDLYLVGKLKGNFPTLKSAIHFARNYDVPVEMIEFITLSETNRNEEDDTTLPLKAKVYMILDTNRMDRAGCYITVKRNSFEGYYPCKVEYLDGRTRQNY